MKPDNEEKSTAAEEQAVLIWLALLVVSIFALYIVGVNTPGSATHGEDRDTAAGAIIPSTGDAPKPVGDETSEPAEFGPYSDSAGKSRAAIWWDWLELIIVPIFLAGGAVYLNRAEKQRDIKRQEQRHRVELFNNYLTEMSKLLMSATPDGPQARKVCRALTITTLTNVKRDEDLRRQIVQFLYESGYLKLKGESILAGVDLNGVRLDRMDLTGANLSRVNLDKASMKGTDLSEANLSWAKMKHSDLSGADLSKAELNNTVLTSAILDKAKFDGCKAFRAFLEHTKLCGTSFSDADLTQVSICEAELDDATNFTNVNIAELRFDSNQEQFLKKYRIS